MARPARWGQMDSPVKPANDDGAGRGPDGSHATPPPNPVTLRLDRRVHGAACALGADGFAGQAGE